MAQRSFAPATNEPFKVQNYYMQVIVAKLVCKTAQTRDDSKYTFSVFKGDRQFETTKEFIIPKGSQGSIPLEKCKMNFAVTSYNPGKPNDFALRMTLSIDEKRAKQVGQFIIDSNQYIDQYNITENGAFVLTVDLNDQFSADLQLYVDRNQHGLFRLIRDIKNPKPKAEKEYEPPVISHQRIAERRKKMDEEADQQVHKNSKEKRFARFSPRREDSEEKHRKTDFLNKRKKEEEEKRAREEEELRIREEEEKKKKKPVVIDPEIRKEWIIPGAEKYMTKTKEKKLSRKSSKDAEKENTETKVTPDASAISRKKPQSVQEQLGASSKFANPKILIPLLLLIIFGAYMLFLRPTEDNPEVVLAGKKGGKVPKIAKGGKSKVSKK